VSKFHYPPRCHRARFAESGLRLRRSLGWLFRNHLLEVIVVAAHLMPLSRGFCACIMVYSVFNVQRKASWRMSLHLSSFLGHFCTLFLSLREKFFDFLHCGANAFGNVLVSDALNPPNFINGHSVNVVHPKSAELCFRQLVPDLRNHRGSHSAPFSFLVLAIHNQISPPTMNIFNQDPECDLDYCANVAREMKIDTALKNNFGFGGTNGSLVFKRV
jgi:hypothetical protein